MWQVILQILAIIGIAVLILAGILILLICIVLFTPIRYRLIGDVDTTTKVYSGSFKATWLLHIITVTGGYPSPGTITIKIFGYPYKVIPANESKNEMASEESEYETSDAPVKSDVKTDEITGAGADDISELKSEEDIEDKIKYKAKENIADDVKPAQKWYHKIVYTIRNLCDKIKEIWNTIQYYRDVFDEKQTRLFIDRSTGRIFKFLKAISPRQLKGNLKVGTGSPDTTGYLLAVYGMLVPYLDKRFTLEPDFEEAVCVGFVSAKGRIFLWTALILILRFATDKHLSTLLRKLKREEQ